MSRLHDESRPAILLGRGARNAGAARPVTRETDSTQRLIRLNKIEFDRIVTVALRKFQKSNVCDPT